MLAAYACIMVYLMLLSRTPRAFRDCNFEVFSTIKHFIRLIGTSYNTAAIMNLAGNVIMFIPLGMLLPCIWNAQRKAYILLPTCALIICAMEAVQYFTMRGTADIDDLILNMAGVLIGYLFYIVFFNNRHK